MNKNYAAEAIANTIIAMLEKGVAPWKMPWKNGGAMSINGNYYRGINAILLSWQDYNDNRWLTFNKVKQLGGKVKKGEKSFPVVFWQFIVKTEKDENGDTITKKIPFLRLYNVFNVEQCEGLKLRENKVFNTENNSIEEAENVWNNYAGKPALYHNRSRAFYDMINDYISIPEMRQFDSAEEYYSTLFHEAVHSTGAKHRLDRLDFDKFGSEKYGKEELVAEIGSAILCQSVGITQTLENSAAYCKSWCNAIKAMPATAIISAASQAQKAVDLILGIKFETEMETE